MSEARAQLGAHLEDAVAKLRHLDAVGEGGVRHVIGIESRGCLAFPLSVA